MTLARFYLFYRSFHVRGLGVGDGRFELAGLGHGAHQLQEQRDVVVPPAHVLPLVLREPAVRRNGLLGGCGHDDGLQPGLWLRHCAVRRLGCTPAQAARVYQKARETRRESATKASQNAFTKSTLDKKSLS